MILSERNEKKREGKKRKKKNRESGQKGEEICGKKLATLGSSASISMAELMGRDAQSIISRLYGTAFLDEQERLAVMEGMATRHGTKHNLGAMGNKELARLHTYLLTTDRTGPSL